MDPGSSGSPSGARAGTGGSGEGTRTCVLEGPTARRGTLMSKPLLGSFSPRRAGSLKGSCPVSQSHTVFLMACRTLGGRHTALTPGDVHGRSARHRHTALAQPPTQRRPWARRGARPWPGPTRTLTDGSLGDRTGPRRSGVAAICINGSHEGRTEERPHTSMRRAETQPPRDRPPFSKTNVKSRTRSWELDGPVSQLTWNMSPSPTGGSAMWQPPRAHAWEAHAPTRRPP